MAEFSGWQLQASNKNLLINPRFKVNQRGQMEYTGVGYTVDGWILYYDHDSSLSIEVGKITLHNSNNAIVQLSQYFENPLEKGRIYTFSVEINNIVYSMQFTGEQSLTKKFGETIIYYVSSMESNNGRIVIAPAKDIDVSAAKLEQGPISTLALDLMQPYTPQDYQRELMECQRYLQVFNFFGKWSGSVNKNGNAIDIAVPLTVPMRISNPTVTLNVISYRLSSGAISSAVPVCTILAVNDTNAANLTIKDSVFTGHERELVSIVSTGGAIISAEL